MRSVGAGLYDTCKRGERAASVPDLFNRFELVNNPATLQLKTALAEKYPNIRWSDSEFETENQQKVEYEGEYWICDAIDGAVQFLQGIYSYAMSLCLVRDGRPLLSFVYDPSHDELFYAVAGEGAFLNGKPIRVAAKEKLKEAIGRLDGYYEFGDEIYNWIAGAFIGARSRRSRFRSSWKQLYVGHFGDYSIQSYPSPKYERRAERHLFLRIQQRLNKFHKAMFEREKKRLPSSRQPFLFPVADSLRPA
ncbi:inositol monophosphatase family protein [Paenibacillus elgii]|uniref:inositol monophosphatase family protein n=1 Tax=Paenibacillus elgii TaxID=189691 RepID=UPI001676DD09|nr:inositol monophosphatase family protein [Paenibacillus elgii]